MQRVRHRTAAEFALSPAGQWNGGIIPPDSWAWASRMVESFHRTLGRGLALLQTSDLSLERATASIMYVYRTTPHSATGQTPAFLATGSHPTFPMLHGLEADVRADEASGRSREIEILRADAVHNMCLRFQAKGQHLPRQGRPQHEEIEVDDVVVCQWTKREMTKRNALYGAAKLAPMWSEPRRVVSIIVPGKQLLVQSLWVRGPPVKVSVHDVRKVLPEEDEGARRENLKYLMQCSKLQKKARQPCPLLRAKLLEHKQRRQDWETSSVLSTRVPASAVINRAPVVMETIVEEEEEEVEQPVQPEGQLPELSCPPPRHTVVVDIGTAPQRRVPPESKQMPPVENATTVAASVGKAATESEGDIFCIAPDKRADDEEWGCVYFATMGARANTGTPSRWRHPRRRQKPVQVDARFSLRGPGLTGIVSDEARAWLEQCAHLDPLGEIADGESEGDESDENPLL
eukprot:GHVU01155050.1.p1 GENE.GHVU01155050.1~~GHVU01155050.1.p1  ORF type:complete len:460 (+),score=46.24 GHVU01155050.1:509-1888(+)